jgi:uncharacterized membrane protein YoaK (UPF0700 family)
MRTFAIPGLLSFNGGFVDTVGFLALQGLFTAHVTGNFVTLAAALVYGSQGIVGKVIALPEFVLMIAAARAAGHVFRRKGHNALVLLLAFEALFLSAFFLLGIIFGPFPNSDAPAALLAGFTAVAAMAIQNAVQRVHYASIPPMTIMTGNTTQAVLDAVDLWWGDVNADRAAVKVRFGRTIRSIGWFAAGCGAGAALYFWTGLLGLAIPAIIGVITAVAARKFKVD